MRGDFDEDEIKDDDFDDGRCLYCGAGCDEWCADDCGDDEEGEDA